MLKYWGGIGCDFVGCGMIDDIGTVEDMVVER